jgi:hypothetical protein
MKRIAIILAAVATLAGCATLQSWLGNTAVQTGVQVAIDIGVGLVLANNPSEAGPIQTAATALAAVASGSGATTVAQFEAAADAKINSITTLNAPEKLALQQVIALAANALTTGASALPPATALDLQAVFTDIANAAGAFSVSAPKAQKMGLHR